MDDNTVQLAKQVDMIYWHLADDHGYDLSGTPVVDDWSDLLTMNTLHDELHRRGDYGPLGRHRKASR
jgi:hypothetical protein